MQNSLKMDKLPLSEGSSILKNKDEIKPENGGNYIKEVNEDYIQPTLNPLDLDIVLLMVLDSLPTNEMVKFRLVCQRWNSLTCTLVRKRPLDSTISLDCRTAPEFTALVKNQPSTGKDGKGKITPFSRLKLTCLSLGDEKLIELVNSCGTSIKHLVFDMSVTDNHDLECELVNNGVTENRDGVWFVKNLLSPLASSLETIDFDEITSELACPSETIIEEAKKRISLECPPLTLRKIIFPAECLQYSEKYWTIIFNAAIKLQEIRLNDSSQAPIFQALVKAQRLAQLKILRLEYMSEVEVDFLLASTPLLEEFKVNIISVTIPRKKLEKLLQKLSTNLKVLALGSPEDDNKIILQLPKMIQLKELGLFHVDDSLILLEGINFKTDLPNLTTLSVSSAYEHLDWKEYLSYNKDFDVEPCHSLNTLTIGLVVDDSEFYPHLGVLFPNVKKLFLEFPKPRSLSTLWSTWQNLKELYIFFADCMSPVSRDALLCGVYGVQDSWIIQMKKLLTMKKNKNRMLSEVFKKEAVPNGLIGISQLKCLQRLIIEETPVIDRKANLILISDISVYFCLKELQELRVLKIGRSKISDDGIEYLRNKLPFLTVDIHGTNGPGIFSPEEKEELVSYIDYYNHRNDDNDE